MASRLVNSYRSVKEVELALKPYASIAAAMTGKHMTIDRTMQLAQYMGSPQDNLKVVHVAGTSGKTSTCYYITDLLHRSGKKVGLSVSPHIDSITERVQIDGKPLSTELFCAYFSEFMQQVYNAPEMPTYFELMMVFALWVFKKENVEYAIIETGLGGLHDSSNITSGIDKLCVLTDIGYDHMHILGKTIQEIAMQKVGIVKQENLLVMHEQPSEVLSVVKKYVEKMNGRLELAPSHETMSFTDIPLFQQRNWQLAFWVYKTLARRDGLDTLSEADMRESRHTHIAGRMDVMHYSGKTIVLDGAHNEQKMSTFLASFEDRFPHKKFAVLIALKQGKELEQLAPLFKTRVTRVIATELNGIQDTPVTSVDPNRIVFALQDCGITDVQSEPDAAKALNTLLASPENVVVVTGSLYLVAQVRKLLQANT